MSKEFKGIQPENLQKIGVDHDVPSETMKHLFDHEYYGHYMNDAKRQGEFGLIITSGWVIAYYMILGERDPEEMMQIAAGPGMSEMSPQDWNIYNDAWDKLLDKLQEEELELKESGPVDEDKLEDVGIDPNDMRIKMIGLIKDKLDDYAREGNFPKLSDLYNTNMSDVFKEYGGLIRHAFNEAIVEVMRDNMQGVANKSQETSEVYDGYADNTGGRVNMVYEN